MIGIVVPTRTDAYARRLLRSLATCEPGFVCRVVFVDNGLSDTFRAEAVGYGAPIADAGIVFVSYTGPFVFAKAINLGVNALVPSDDILIMNDDAAFCSPRPIAALEALLEEPTGNPLGCYGCAHDAAGRAGKTVTAEWPKHSCCPVRDVFGVLGLRVEGGVGNPDQTAPLRADQILETDKAICFVAALIPREVWDKVGGLDEDLVGYGFDDVSFCRSAAKLGYKLGVTGAATVRHGGVGIDRGPGMHGSYAALGVEEHTRLYLLNQEIYRQKWGDDGRGEIR